MAGIDSCSVSSVVWELKRLGMNGKHKDIRLLNKFGSDSLSVTCDTCDAHYKTNVGRSDNDLCVTITRIDNERFLSVHIPHNVFNATHELTIIEIGGMPIFKRSFPPKTISLVEKLFVEPYLGNSGLLIIRFAREDDGDVHNTRKNMSKSAMPRKKRASPIKYKAVGGSDSEESASPTKISIQECELPLMPEPALPITFVFNNGEKLLACKARLSIKSTVFATMFGHNQKECLEAITNEVKITDCDYPTYKRFLQFLHFDKEVYLKTSGESLKECAERLLPLANKYFIQDLANYCAIILVDNLTERTACHTIDLLQMYYNGSMKRQCLSKTLEFIKDNPNIMKNLDRWNDLAKKYPELLREVITNCLTKSGKSKDN